MDVMMIPHIFTPSTSPYYRVSFYRHIRANQFPPQLAVISCLPLRMYLTTQLADFEGVNWDNCWSLIYIAWYHLTHKLSAFIAIHQACFPVSVLFQCISEFEAQSTLTCTIADYVPTHITRLGISASTYQSKEINNIWQLLA